MLDRDRGLVQEAHEEADLHEHEGHGEGHARDGDREAEPVVQEVLAGERDHVSVLRREREAGSARKPRMAASTTCSTRSGAAGACGPLLRLQGDEERDRPVHAGPQHLGHGVDVAGAEVAALDGRRHRGTQRAPNACSPGGRS